MKNSKHHNHPRHTAAEPQPVRFEFFDPAATAVAIAGTFNEWQPTAKPMHPVGSRHWLKETVLPPGTYEYCLVVDGQWRPDPAARESVPNPYGGRNSILKVARTPAGARLAAAENAPLKNAGQSASKNL
jgi:1,4-alpha-glucan branching enzyme